MTEIAAPATPADRRGLFAGLLCYGIWGFLPLLFNAAERSGAGVFEIVAWRTILSVPLAFGLVWVVDRAAALRALLLQPRQIALLALSAFLIAVNWTTYVWAVEAGKTLSASLGYYINPLVNMAAGALMFRERINRTGQVAIALAAIGVAIQGVALGQIPWISLILAFSFGGYGIVRKKAAADAQTGLLVECIILALPAIAYVAWLTAGGHNAFGRSVAPTALLILCGPATVIPLALFAFAARRLPLTIVGFLQFIAPTIQFFIALGLGEKLTPAAAVSFAFIWAGVAVFAGGAIINSRRPAA
jgi:chloramphenicol-sensitive protein RarD